MSNNVIEWAHRELRPFIRAALANGWRVEKYGTHLKWYAPDGVSIVHSSGVTMTKKRVLNNIRENLRKAGLDLDENGKLKLKLAKEEIVMTGSNGLATTSLGEAIAAAREKQPEERKEEVKPDVIDDRPISRVMAEILNEYPTDYEWTPTEMESAIKKRGKLAPYSAIQVAMGTMVKQGKLRRLGRGCYVRSGLPLPIVGQVITPIVGTKTGDAQVDADLAALDEALAEFSTAFDKVTGIIKRNRKILHQVAQLKQSLQGFTAGEED